MRARFSRSISLTPPLFEITHTSEMTGTRDVEGEERIKAEADRRETLTEELDKGNMYAMMAAQMGGDLGESDDDEAEDDDVDVTSDEDGNLAHNNTGVLRARRPDDSDEDSEDTDLDMLVGDVDMSGNEMSEGELGERLAGILAGRDWRGFKASEGRHTRLLALYPFVGALCLARLKTRDDLETM